MQRATDKTSIQQTLRTACTVSGRGYWSGTPNTLHLRPAEENFGIQFEVHGRRLPALTENSSGLSLRTRIGNTPFAVDMVEHVMAALYGLGVDNCLIACDDSEIPGFDGSSLPITLAIKSVGIRQQSQARECFVLKETLRVGDDNCWIVAEPTNGDSMEIEYQLAYPNGSPIADATFATVLSADTFLDEIAPARTFVTEQEAASLQAAGLARHVTHQDLLVFGANGPINNSLRFPDECARHKALDLIGDLALSGVNLIGRFTARKSGHQLNAQMAKLLREKVLAERRLTASSKRAA